MYSSLIVATFITLFTYYCSSSPILPSSITPCKGTDPNLNECAKKEANKFLPVLVKGLPEFRVPVLDPLVIPEIKVKSNGNQLNIFLKNANVTGLGTAFVEHFNFDLKGHKIHATLSIPHLNIQGDYKMNGRILVIPVRGKGPANMAISDTLFNVDVEYSVYKNEDVEYIKIDKFDISFEIGNAVMRFENLFNDDKELSENANNLINKEWRQVLKQITPEISETISEIGIQIADGVAQKISYAEMFGGELP
ncbi:circadian clock-controlled protein daywake-like [Chrysoperla carnea]|uniref:circadian clock-controlled protein daywake-like n=1 Tax=Chrysoperla carnea TaxID=189513 RepID=UPI001D08AF60|nr:circadian clock-controlled protein daywake-like [Chrysoperla carnea]